MWHLLFERHLLFEASKLPQLQVIEIDGMDQTKTGPPRLEERPYVNDE